MLPLCSVDKDPVLMADVNKSLDDLSNMGLRFMLRYIHTYMHT